MEYKRSGPPSYVSSPPSYTSHAPSNNGATYSSDGPPTKPVYPGPPAHPGSPPTQTAYPGVAPAVTVTQQPMTHVIVVQPAAGTAVPDSYLAWSILTCLCCCWPLGLVAIIFSCISRSDAESGRFEDARRYGRVAMWLSVAALVIGLAWIITVIVMRIQAVNDQN